MRAGRHPGTASRGARHPGRHDVLDPVPVRPVGLQQLGEPGVVERLPGQRVAHVRGDVVVPEADRVRVTVQFAKSSQTKARTLRLSFSRCHSAVVKPQFTG